MASASRAGQTSNFLAGWHALCLTRQMRTSAWSCLCPDKAELGGCHERFSAGCVSALQVFKVAKAMAPSVIHIDEVEKVFVSDKKRAKEFGGTELFSRIKKELGKEVGCCLHRHKEPLREAVLRAAQHLLVTQSHAQVPPAATVDLLLGDCVLRIKKPLRWWVAMLHTHAWSMSTCACTGRLPLLRCHVAFVGARQCLTSLQHSGPLGHHPARSSVWCAV